MKRLLPLFLLIATLYACKPQVPSDYLQPREMEDILYDYHLAQAMARQQAGEKGISEEMYQIAYREAALQKHGVTEAQFDSSMVYYQRHTERLKGIYENLAKRLTAEAQSLGASVDDANSLGDLTATGDTANVWRGERSLVLSPDAPFNHYSFSIEADSSFHKGDRFILNFKSQFIYQDGMRDGVAYVAVTYDNDSVATSIVHVMSDGKQSLRIENFKGLGIKSIKGYFVLTKSTESTSTTTLRLMFITQISLIRVHQDIKPVEEKAPADSLSTTSTLADSTHRPVAPTPPEGVLPPRNGRMPLPPNRVPTPQKP